MVLKTHNSASSVTATKPPLNPRLLTQQTADRLLTQQTAEAKSPELSDDDDEDPSDSFTSVSSEAPPSQIISPGDVYVNLLRLDKAKAEDFRKHPDRKNRVEVGSAQDCILGATQSGRIT
jgi:hypothetical protein